MLLNISPASLLQLPWSQILNLLFVTVEHHHVDGDFSVCSFSAISLCQKFFDKMLLSCQPILYKRSSPAFQQAEFNLTLVISDFL